MVLVYLAFRYVRGSTNFVSMLFLPQKFLISAQALVMRVPTRKLHVRPGYINTRIVPGLGDMEIPNILPPFCTGNFHFYFILFYFIFYLFFIYLFFIFSFFIFYSFFLYLFSFFFVFTFYLFSLSQRFVPKILITFDTKKKKNSQFLHCFLIPYLTV